MLLIQVAIWVIGIASAIYIAGYQLFFSGAVDMVMAIGEIISSGTTKELAITAVVGFIKCSLAGLACWLILLVTGVISAIISESK